MYMNVYVVVQMFILGVSLSFYTLFWSLIVHVDNIETVGNRTEPQHILVLKFNHAIFHLISLSLTRKILLLFATHQYFFNIVGRFC